MQIGATAYIDYGGRHIVSVKQFKGCDKKWAYMYAWQTFVDSHKSFFMTSGVGVFGLVTQPDPDYLVGVVHGRTGQREVWSSATDTVTNCTSAVGDIALVTDDKFLQVYSQIRC
ncbi:hypothetical protein [Kutzneria sp. NPDC051319]|uniref:hypothetical protein n=1 Tax=Kutzneria sp. NPDC051319 TaxID=3155047 RepID=UPI0034300DAB